MSNNILVCYATGTGSTREVAEAIGDELSRPGVDVRVRHVKEVVYINIYSAVVLGSSIRLGRWLPDAVSFLERHKEELSQVPVAYFTTCMTMVDDTAESRRTVLAYLEPIRQLAPEIDPVGLGLFAGSLSPNMQLVIPDIGPYGDYRDWEAIRAWAREIRPALLAGEIAGKVADSPIVLGGAILSYTDMSGSDLRDSDFHGAKLHRATLIGTDMQRADLVKADLTQANLSQADLRGASLGWAELDGSQMSGADLREANLVGARLKQADLSRANLSRAVMNGADLGEASLRGANLSGADLNWADFRKADLSGADLREASIGWADFSDSDLRQAKLSKARYNEQTRWPEGFSAEDAGCILVSSAY